VIFLHFYGASYLATIHQRAATACIIIFVVRLRGKPLNLGNIICKHGENCMSQARDYDSTEIFYVRHTIVFKWCAYDFDMSWGPFLYPSMSSRNRRTNGEKTVRLACWKADGVHGRILELDNFLSQNGRDICLLNEMQFCPVQVFRFANCLPPYRPVNIGRRYSNIGPPGNKSLNSTLARSKAPAGNWCTCNVGQRTGENPGHLLLALPAPIESDFSAYLCGGLPVLGGDLNAKHVVRRSWLVTTRGRLLRDENSSLVYGLDTRHYSEHLFLHP
jgi:hypothetical protein